jgi:hypothetical protein
MRKRRPILTKLLITTINIGGSIFDVVFVESDEKSSVESRSRESVRKKNKVGALSSKS